jgi:hypothetical protein
MKFQLKQRVKLPVEVHKDISGRILSIWIGDDGIQYKVRYFWESKPTEVYFFEDELEGI